MIIKPEQFFQEMADVMNKALAEMPDDETRHAVLNAFIRQMFCDTREIKNENN